MEYDLTVIIPTLNEAETIENTVANVQKAFLDEKINGNILVVDDNSSLDATIFILNDLKRKYQNFDFMVRQRDHGLSQSLVDGFGVAKSDVLMVIDADGQHPSAKIPELYAAIREGNDIAIASRYMEGGGFENFAHHRKLLSWGATYLAKFFFPGITDSGSGFFAFRKKVIENALLKPQGFRMLFEILGKGNWKTVKEIPYTFGVRKQGVSKLSAKTVGLYLSQLWGLFTYSLANKTSRGHAEIVRVLKFMAVGASGVVVNLTMLTGLTGAGVWYPLSGLVGIETSILTNFLLNDSFTFSDRTPVLSTGKRLKLYHLVSITGIVITWGLLVGLTEMFGVHYIISAYIGILVAFVWNFTMNRETTWGE